GVTNNLKFKINYCSDKRYYKDLRVGVDKLCYECYMKIVDSYQHQISTINRNIELNDLVETDLIESNNLAEDDTSTNLMEINNLIEISESNISTNLMEINKLIEISESNISTNLMETNNLIKI
ncbi:44547_t:CDS:1, partial [Gigaspora margarita]